MVRIAFVSTKPWGCLLTHVYAYAGGGISSRQPVLQPVLPLQSTTSDTTTSGLFTLAILLALHPQTHGTKILPFDMSRAHHGSEYLVSKPALCLWDLRGAALMAHYGGLLNAQMTTEPLFRRIPNGLSTVFQNLDVDTRYTSTVLDHDAAPASRETGGQSNRQPASEQQLTSSHKSRLVIAVDFGTTYSTVSYAVVNHGVDASDLGVNDIHCIDDYKNATGRHECRGNSRVDNVPTEILYLGSITSTSDDSESDSDSDVSIMNEATSQDNILPKKVRSGGRKRGKKRRAKIAGMPACNKWVRPAGTTLKWGFSVQDMQKYPENLKRYRHSETVKLIKLSLGDEANHLTGKRTELAAQIGRLRGLSFVRNRDQVLQDYLTRLLRHAKCVLRRDAGLQDDTDLEFVLCVPVSWSESACRTMHDAMARAIQNCELGNIAQDVISDLFIVSEPEAAAQFVLASLGEKDRLLKDEVFILLDAGGGTVDITSYKVTSDGVGPLRLKGEIVKPDGALCGSSLISDRYAKALRIKLQAENMLEGSDMEARITALTNDWDLNDKPQIDVVNKKYKGRRVFVHDRRIQWTKEEIDALFEPSLQDVIKLLEDQLELAGKGNFTVSKLIVVGGFGESPSLRARIQQVISTKLNIIGAPVEVIWPRHFPTSAVARGAVLRALNKQNGPTRHSRSSFGFLRHEQHMLFPEHEEARVKPKKDGRDHYPQVRNTIYWVIQAVSPP